MAAPFRLMEVAFSAESAFAENVSTWTHRIPVLEPPTMTLTQERIPDAGLQSRQSEEEHAHPGPRSCELQFQTRAIGHLTTAAGALTETWQQVLLRLGLGAGNVAQVGTTISGTSSTTTVINVTDASTFVAGAPIRVGSKGDGKGDGAVSIISSIDTGATPDAVTLKNALPAAPTTAGHVVYACQVAYPDESTITSMTSLRFIVSHTTTGAQYVMRGMQLAGLEYNAQPSEMPTFTWTWRGAYWERLSDTTPSARTLLDSFSAPVAGGRFSYNDTGSTAATALTAANIRLSINRDLQPIMGPQGTFNEQYINGYTPVMTKASLSFDVPWSTTFETIWDTANQSQLKWWFNYQTSSVDGRVTGFYVPAAIIIGARPTITEVNGQNYQTVTFSATDAGGGSELPASNFRFYSA